MIHINRSEFSTLSEMTSSCNRDSMVAYHDIVHFKRTKQYFEEKFFSKKKTIGCVQRMDQFIDVRRTACQCNHATQSTIMTVYGPTQCCYMHLINQPKSSCKICKIWKEMQANFCKCKGVAGNIFCLESSLPCQSQYYFGTVFSWLLFTNIITLFGFKEESFLYEGFISSWQSFISFYTWYTNFQDQHSWDSIDGTTTAKHAIHSSTSRFSLKKPICVYSKKKLTRKRQN